MKHQTKAGFSILLINIIVTGAFGVLLAYAIVGMIEPAGNLYFGNACPSVTDLNQSTEVARVY